MAVATYALIYWPFALPRERAAVHRQRCQTAISRRTDRSSDARHSAAAALGLSHVHHRTPRWGARATVQKDHIMFNTKITAATCIAMTVAAFVAVHGAAAQAQTYVVKPEAISQQAAQMSTQLGVQLTGRIAATPGAVAARMAKLDEGTGDANAIEVASAPVSVKPIIISMIN